jgi:peptidoglycan-associated lipoprotein
MAARQYLIQLGIDENALRILSYGEEKPASYGASESDYRQNRRVEFQPK